MILNVHRANIKQLSRLEKLPGLSRKDPWPQLFKTGWRVLSTGEIFIQRITQLFSLIPIHWIVMYSVDSIWVCERAQNG